MGGGGVGELSSSVRSSELELADRLLCSFAFQHLQRILVSFNEVPALALGMPRVQGGRGRLGSACESGDVCVQPSNQASASHRVRRLRVFMLHVSFLNRCDQSSNLAAGAGLEPRPQSWPVVSLPAETFVPR